MASAKQFSVFAKFIGIDKLSGPTKVINANLNRLDRNLKRVGATAARTRFSMASGFKGLATGIIGASAAFAIWDRGILGTIKRGAELETILTQAGAKFGKDANIIRGTAGFKALEDAALSAGLKTEFSATQSAKALKVLAQAGLGVEQAIATLPQVVDFATAAGLNLERATSIAADSIGAMGSNIKDLAPKELAKKMAEINDIMVITSNTFNTSVEEMFEATTKGGRVLTTLIGASGFQFAALVGEAANAGLKAEVAGTGIRAAFLKMVSGRGAASKSLRRLGVDLTDSGGKMKDIITIMADLRTGFAGVKDEARKTKIMTQLFGRVGINVMTTLLSRSEKQMRATVAQMAAQRGEVRRIAKLVRSTLTNAWVRFLSIMESFGLLVFKRIEGGLKGMVSGLQKVGNKLVAAAGPLTEMTGFLFKAWTVTKLWNIALFILSKRFLAIIVSNPFGIIAASLLALTVMFPEASASVLKYKELIFFLGTTMFFLSKTTLIATGIAKAWMFAVATWATVVRFAGGVMLLFNVLTNSYSISAGIATAATWLFNTALFVLTSPITLVVVAIGLLIAAVIWLVNNWDKLTTALATNWITSDFLMNPFQSFIKTLTTFLPDSLKTIFSASAGLFAAAFPGAGGLLSLGDSPDDVNVNKNLDISRSGDIAPSPAAAAAVTSRGRVNVNFENKPEDVTIDEPEQDDDELILISSG